MDGSTRKKMVRKKRTTDRTAGRIMVTGRLMPGFFEEVKVTRDCLLS